MTPVLEHLLIPFFLVWFIFLVLLLGRRTFALIYRILSFFVFLFFIFLFWDKFYPLINAYQENWIKELLLFLFALAKLLPVFLFFLWPFTLIIVFYKADDIGAEKMVKVLSIFSLLFLLSFSLYIYYHTFIDKFINDSFAEYLH